MARKYCHCKSSRTHRRVRCSSKFAVKKCTTRRRRRRSRR